jgi:hypothetical protein
MDNLENKFSGVWKTDQRPANAEPEDGDVVIDFDLTGKQNTQSIILIKKIQSP